jgi:hypothetical protein
MDTFQSILPEFDVFQPPPAPQAPPGGQMLGAARAGKAAKYLMSPGGAMLAGLGDDTTAAMPGVVPANAMSNGAASAGSMVLGLLFLAGVGYLSYEVGVAMTPSGSNKLTWGLIGVPLGIFTGPVGLGVMALVANHRKG